MNKDESDNEAYQNHLRTAVAADLREIERCGCVQISYDDNGDAVILFIPQLAIEAFKTQQ